MRPQWDLKAELTEAAVEAARKSPVSRTIRKRSGICWGVFSFNHSDILTPYITNPLILRQ